MWKIILIIFGIIIAMIIIFRIMVKWATSGESLISQAKGALSKIGDCCRKWLTGA